MEIDDIKNIIDVKLQSSVSTISEDETKEIFKLFNIPVVNESVAKKNTKSILNACHKTGYPIVLKASGSDILHKTEAGLVHVGLDRDSQVVEAVDRMMKRSGKSIEKFLIQPVVEGKREFIAGMFRDPQFGPVIIFGVGGIFTEAIHDIAYKIAPLDSIDMEEMIEQISSKNLLKDFRGEKKADKKILKIIIQALSDIAIAFPDISEIDINPLIIRPDGNPVAVDGLIILGKEKKYKKRDYNINLKILGSCYYPKSIAFIGASATPGKWGHMLLTNTLSRNYKGQVYFVNPRGGEIAGHPVYKSAGDIEHSIDLAVVTIPAKNVMDLIPDLKKKKVKGILLITSGFREVGVEGEKLEKNLIEAACRAEILILGPNTMGICNPHIDFFCNAAHVYPLPGSTALVCQSGNMGTQLLAFAGQQDIGIRSFTGSGNEAMVTIEDYMEAFEIDELTKIVVLYIESVKNGRRFFNSAKRVSRKKPVVVLKGGRTATGEKAALSHTGAMASNAEVFNAACRQAGIIQVDQPQELLDLSAAFSSLPLPRGKRVGIMTLGGGWGVITADLCAEHHLEVPELSRDIKTKLDKILPPYWSRANPVDIVGENNPEIPMTCLEELLKWDECDAVIHLGIHGKRIFIDAMAESIRKADPDIDKAQALFLKDSILQFEDYYTRYTAELTQKYGKPVFGVSLLTDEKSRIVSRHENYKYKTIFFPSPERAVKVLSGMYNYYGWLEKHSEI